MKASDACFSGVTSFSIAFRIKPFGSCACPAVRESRGNHVKVAGDVHSDVQANEIIFTPEG